MAKAMLFSDLIFCPNMGNKKCFSGSAKKLHQVDWISDPLLPHMKFFLRPATVINFLLSTFSVLKGCKSIPEANLDHTDHFLNGLGKTIQLP